MGESWHNLHHADPTCARHGIGRGQIDLTARVIWAFERLGWIDAVRWPTTRRLARLTRRVGGPQDVTDRGDPSRSTIERTS
jgi:stearoyl-CoA desaturase (delta-9 desaturase)